MFVAPAGPIDIEKIKRCKDIIESKGFTVIVPDNLTRQDRYLAGSDEERAAELNAAIRHEGVKAIFPCRGGYGLSRILDKIDYDALRENPKIITGFSDLTALHLAVFKKSKIVTFHSPMPQYYLWREDGEYEYSADLFWNILSGKGYSSEVANRYRIPLPEGRSEPKCLVPGRAVGRLIGGNLTLIGSTLGTPYQIETAGAILFIEDTGEEAYKIDRILSQLRLAGLLDRLAGVIVGTFDGADEGELESVLKEHLGSLSIPVITNYPIGHTSHNATIPCGVEAEIDSAMLTVRLLESPVLQE